MMMVAVVAAVGAAAAFWSDRMAPVGLCHLEWQHDVTKPPSLLKAPDLQIPRPGTPHPGVDI